MSADRGALFHRLRVLRREVRLFARDSAIAFRACRRPLRVVLTRIRGERPLRVELRNGVRIAGPAGRSLLPLVAEVLLRSEYERFGVRVKQGDIVVDIGAHVGAFSLLAVRRGAERVIAYEPSAVNVSYLRENLEANCIDTVVVHHAAVGPSDGDVHLHHGRESVGGRVIETTQQLVHSSSQRTSTVGCVSLASLISNNGLTRIDLLKLDCEGSEGAILAGTREEDLAIVGAIVLEYHEPWSLMSAEDIAALLVRHGFRTNVAPGADPQFGMIFAQRSSGVPAPPADTSRTQHWTR